MLIANIWGESYLGLWQQTVKYGFLGRSKLRLEGQSQHYSWHIQQAVEEIKVSDAKGLKAWANQKHFKKSCFSLTIVFCGEQ